MAEQLSYTVTHGFSAKVGGEERWFSRDNVHEVNNLPRALRDELLATGAIQEFNAKGELTARTPEPAPPATTTGKEK